MLDMVGNPGDQFSPVVAHFTIETCFNLGTNVDFIPYSPDSDGPIDSEFGKI